MYYSYRNIKIIETIKYIKILMNKHLTVHKYDNKITQGMQS